MLTIHIGLISQTPRVSLPALMQASAALQKQALRDFGPIWNVQATVNSFSSLSQLPIGYWPVLIRDDIGVPGAAGIHMDRNGQPYALVQYSPGWVLTTSHEILEMLADPLGNRVVAGQSPKAGQGRVEFLVEVSDPSEDKQFGYTVNGLLVSDFYTPQFFDPVANSSVRYSYTGAIKKPRQVLKGGYLSWRVPTTNHWWQQTWFSGAQPVFRDIGILTGQGSLRSQIDALSPTEITIPKALSKKTAAAMLTASASDGLDLGDDYGKATSARGASLVAEITDLKKSLGLK